MVTFLVHSDIESIRQLLWARGVSGVLESVLVGSLVDQFSNTAIIPGIMVLPGLSLNPCLARRYPS